MTGREKMLRYDRKRKNAVCDRKILIRRSLDVFLRKRGMTRTAGARRICCFGLSALEARCLQCALSRPKVLYAMTLLSPVIPGLTRNPGG